VDEDALPGVAAGARRAGQGEEIGAAGDAAGRPALDRRGADLLIAQHAEDLAEAGDLLVVDGVEGLRRDVAPGDAGAAGGDHHVDRGVGDPGVQLLDDARLVVAHDAARGDAVAGRGDQLGKRVAGPVVGRAARGGYGEEGDV